MYGNGKIEGKPRKKRNRNEEIEQEKFNKWFDEVLWPKGYRWFHPANGGRRNLIEGAKFKRMGVKKGVPDIFMPVPRKDYHGLVIELKGLDRNLCDVTPEQENWINWFNAHNYYSRVAFGFEEAKKIVLEYLGVYR